MSSRPAKRSKKEEECWLMKVPAFVLDAWKRQGPSSALGMVTMPDEATGQPTIKVHYPEQQQQVLHGYQPIALQKPTDGTVRLNPGGNRMAIFQEVKGGGIQYCGMVKQVSVAEFSSHDAAYRSLLTTRVSKSMDKQDIQRIDGKNPLSTCRVTVIKKAPEKIKAVADNKKKGMRVRMKAPELKKLIIQLFDVRPQYSFKDLQERTNQPQAHLKQILDTMCDRDLKKHVYRLKNEYKGS